MKLLIPLVVGLFTGLLLGCGIIFAIQHLPTTVKAVKPAVVETDFSQGVRSAKKEIEVLRAKTRTDLLQKKITANRAVCIFIQLDNAVGQLWFAENKGSPDGDTNLAGAYSFIEYAKDANLGLGAVCSPT